MHKEIKEFFSKLTMVDFEEIEKATQFVYPKNGKIATLLNEYCKLFKSIYSISADKNDFFGAAMEYYRNDFDKGYYVERKIEQILA